MAGLLHVWLKELPEPLIRTQLFAEVVNTQKHENEIVRLHSVQAVLKQVLFMPMSCRLIIAMLLCCLDCLNELLSRLLLSRLLSAKQLLLATMISC